MRNDVDFSQQSFSGTRIQMTFLCKRRGFLISGVAFFVSIFVACARKVLSRCLRLPSSLVFLSWCVSLLPCSCFLTCVVVFSAVILSVSIDSVCAYSVQGLFSFRREACRCDGKAHEAPSRKERCQHRQMRLRCGCVWKIADARCVRRVLGKQHGEYF